MKKNNTWNIRHLVNETIVPLTQRPSVLYWRLSDFRCILGQISQMGFRLYAFWQSGQKGKISSNFLKYPTFDGIFLYFQEKNESKNRHPV